VPFHTFVCRPANQPNQLNPIDLAFHSPTDRTVLGRHLLLLLLLNQLWKLLTDRPTCRDPFVTPTSSINTHKETEEERERDINTDRDLSQTRFKVIILLSKRSSFTSRFCIHKQSKNPIHFRFFTFTLFCSFLFVLDLFRSSHTCLHCNPKSVEPSSIVTLELLRRFGNHPHPPHYETVQEWRTVIVGISQRKSCSTVQVEDAE
jgi:hypothetical protein